MDLHKNSGTSSVATKAMPHRSVAAEANKQAESRGKNTIGVDSSSGPSYCGGRLHVHAGIHNCHPSSNFVC